MSGMRTIGEAAKICGVKVPTIRYYEDIGLMQTVERTESNRRLYSGAEIKRLNFIRHSRELGFEIEAIRTLLKLQDNPHQSCADVDAIAKTRLAEIDTKIAKLSALREEIALMVTTCNQTSVRCCRVLEVLKNQ